MDRRAEHWPTQINVHAGPTTPMTFTDMPIIFSQDTVRTASADQYVLYANMTDTITSARHLPVNIVSAMTMLLHYHTHYAMRKPGNT
jgi:hypothetical protein